MATLSLKLFGLRKIVAWAMDDDAVLGAAITASTGTQVTLASGDGVDFVDASAALPHKIKVDNEIMYVTAVSGDILTVERGKDSTTPTTHSNGATVDHLHSVRLNAANAFSMDANINTIEFPGDGDVERVFQSQGVSGTFQLSKFVTDILDKFAGAAGISAGLRSDEAKRWLPEEGDYPYVELAVDLRAEREDTGADATVRTTIPLCKLQNPMILGDAGNNDAQQTTFNWSSTGTTVDIWGLAVAGATDEIHFWYSLLS